MGILNFWNKQPSNRHRLTQEDAEKAGELNRMRFENHRRKLERENALLEMEAQKRELQIRRDMTKLQAEILEYEGETEEAEDGGGIEKTMTNLLMSAVLKNQAPQYPQAGGLSKDTPLFQPPALSLTDEQLTELWETVPKQYRKIAKKLTDEQINALISSKVGNVDSDTRTRALNIIKG